jgi:hypothetical protein
LMGRNWWYVLPLSYVATLLRNNKCGQAFTLH